MRAKDRSLWILLLLLLVGIVIGGVIGDLFGDKVEILQKSYALGINPPIHLDLNVIDLTFGIMLDINVASVIGLVLAILIFRKI